MMTSSRPYLIRAIYEWIADNNMTPFVMVNAHYPGVFVPSKYIQNGKIVLNTSATAVNKLIVSNEAIEFDARFSGIIHNIYIPIAAVSAIYASENSRGIVFEEDDSAVSSGGGGSPPSPPSDKAPSVPKRGKPTLTIVK